MHHTPRPLPGTMRRIALGLLAVALVVSTAAAARAGQPPKIDAKTAAKIAKLEAKMRAEQSQGRHWDALQVGEKVLKLKRKALGKDHPDLYITMTQVGAMRQATGDYHGAVDMYEELLALQRKHHPEVSQQVADAKYTLGVSLWVLRDYERAGPLMKEALDAKEKLYGRDSVMYAVQLQMAASLAMGRHSYQEAEQQIRRAMAIVEKLQGPESTMLAGMLMTLGWTLWQKGAFTKAGEVWDRMLVLYEKIYGRMKTKEHMAPLLQMLATLYMQKGDTQRSEALFARAQALLETAASTAIEKHGKGSSQANLARRNLASLHMARGHIDEAERIYRELYAEDIKQHGAGSVAGVVNAWQLAEIARRRKNYAAAIKLYKEIEKAYTKSFGAFHTAGPQTMMADTYRLMGRLDKAIALNRKVLKAYQKTMGKDHPLNADHYERIGMLEVIGGKTRQGIALLQKAQDLFEPYVRLVLSSGTEEDNRAFMAQRAYQLDLVLSLHHGWAKDDAAAARLAMETILRRKVRLLDAVTDSIGALRSRMTPTDRKLLDKLATARSRLARLVVAGPKTAAGQADYAKRVAALEDEVRRLEADIRKRSSRFRAVSEPVTLEAVQKLVPADAALVEYVSFHRYDPRKVTATYQDAPKRYAAYVLQPGKAAPAFVDLGPARAVDDAVDALREGLKNPNTDVLDTAKALHKLVWAPVEPLLAGKRKVLVSPDASLNLVPFGAMADPGGRFLVTRYELSYLSSGRDLLRMQVHGKPREGARIFANPEFDGAREAAPAAPDELAPVTSPTRGRRARGLRGMKWKPLPGTALEAEALHEVLAKSKVAMGAEATEEALKAVKGPRILHVATHGFFLPDEEAELPIAAMTPDAPDPSGGGSAAQVMGAPMMIMAPEEKSGGENPLLRSGLALTAANQLRSVEREDGVLTALEAAGLDLWGTQLVVLSACETAVGEARAGDGVHGLRRALVIAGAETLVMSLWQVDDEATRRLMTDFYRRLDRGRGRSAALRSVQLKMLKNPQYSHPYYWAAFIAAGQWEPLR